MARRDFALMAVMLALVGAILGAAAVLTTGAVVATAVCGGPWQLPPVGTWLTTALAILAHPGHLEDAIPAPWGPVLAGRAGTYWAITASGATASAVAIAAVSRIVWRAFAPMPSGHASRADIRRELSRSAARRTAKWTRPSMTWQERQRAPIEQVAVPSHDGPHGRALWLPLENPTGAVAPTQSSKSRGDLVHKVMAAGGALLCSTTKPDLFEFSALSRIRDVGGPVLVFDVTGSVRWPAKLRWSPVAGCTDPDVAWRRAEAMVGASSTDLQGVSGNDKVFRNRAKVVLQAYLLAAANARRGVDALVDWSITRASEPVQLLMPHAPELAKNLRQEVTMVAETSDAVWLSVRRALEPLMQPNLRELCSPPAGEEFDAEAFIRARGTLYLIASREQAALAAPILTALADLWLTTAQDMALHTEHNRLEPPVSTMLDELPIATPVPKLPKILADSAGRGVLVHWAAQSIAQLEEAYDQLGARQLIDNTTALSIYSGLKDQRTLEWISVLAGHHERLRFQQHADGALSVGRATLSTEDAPVYRPGAVRMLRRERVLLIHRHLRPLEARLVDVTQRRDWKQIKADIAAVRSGSAAVRADGSPIREVSNA
ncbi:type IV secretory system conjugative DNA transfer family protein [Saccharopolyspora elongata]|uniref:Type IV secretory system conjugative DNA transfer family protein n=1 Tax=Saccharopolyspora elongata TaxID=2530387 RepID=A0A4R4Y4F2_9PSEU|nr:TraM recognition domain-containing protein [Saccharopolyspora elongata]TDD37782.1 type IV secretory system conjugative DNA transfer family protein [Saccharopolyspora elongata]